MLPSCQHNTQKKKEKDLKTNIWNEKYSCWRQCVNMSVCMSSCVSVCVCDIGTFKIGVCMGMGVNINESIKSFIHAWLEQQ